MNKIERMLQELCPNGVEYKKLEDIGCLFSGLTGKNKEDFKDGNAKFVSYMNVYSNPALNLNIEDKVRISDGEEQNTIQYGDILFTGSSETPEECGMTSIVTQTIEEAIYLNSFCFGLRLNNIERFDVNFLKHLFRCDSIRKLLQKTANGVTRFNVSKKRLLKIEIPIPPLEVQTQIAYFLDHFTELTASLQAELQAELQARQEQYEYYRNRLLTFAKIGGGTQSVTWMKMSEILISIRTGLNPRRFFKLNTPEAKNYYVTIREIKGGQLCFSEKTDRINNEALKLCNNRSNLEIGDVLFSGTGTIGETFVITEKPTNWNIKEGVYSLKAKKEIINSFYLRYILMAKYIKDSYMAKVEGGAVKSISMKLLGDLKIPVPPISEQQRIVTILDKFETLVNDLSLGLPAEIAAVQEQYEYYRNKLLTFNRLN